MGYEDSNQDARLDCPELDTAALDALLENAFPKTTVVEVSPLEGTGDNTTLAVETEHLGWFVLKWSRDETAMEQLHREMAITPFVAAETDVPVVEPITYSMGQSGTPSFVVTPWAQGRSLDETLSSLGAHHHPLVFASIGETLATLHEQTDFSHPGRIVPNGLGSFTIDAAPGWPELFEERVFEHVESLQGTRFEEVGEEVLEFVTNRLQDLETGETPVLLHGDIGDGNLTYDGTDVSCVLDWERAFVGHPEFDLCRAEVRYFLNNWGEPSRLQAMLYAGYRSIRELEAGFEDRRRSYLATFFLLPLSRFSRWASTVTDDPDALAERLARTIRDLMQ